MENEHKGHRKRMRDKYTVLGADAFESHQLLEMLLYHVVRQGDTNPMAHRVLDLADEGAYSGKTEKELCKAEGVGEGSANLLRISSDVSIRLLCDKHCRLFGTVFLHRTGCQ